ncbi:hypothetical protein AEB_P3103 [Altererythrobacter sp. B11]|uniref:tetratricopeptide repeat protein n=1 Tax=Altererythrobacter sp. B11 TaxID=2060312 RepID=UPI000DC71046|nr:hypothetical protein [Altererythrobacter sp. B11]BBC73971.1 hypothetical protein AEB_P3103 [Altererythrobacter sp. B11]
MVVALLLLVILTASWNRGIPTAGRPLLATFPEDPAREFEHALDDMRRTQGRSVPRSLPAIERAARLDTLSASPLFLESLSRILVGEQAEVRVLEAARRRNPRFPEPRLLLLDIYARSGRTEDAVMEAQTLLRLMPRNRDLIVRLIAGLAGRPHGAEALESALPRSEARGAVMLRLEQTGEDVALLQRLALAMRGIGEDPDERKWITSLVERVAERGEPAVARALWADLYGVDRATVGLELTNAGFDRDDTRPPFDWRLAGGRAGVAEIRNGMLNVLYYGRTNAVFARQMLALPPGRYVLGTEVAPSPQIGTPGSLAWRLICQGEKNAKHLVNLALGGQAQPSPQEFTVPPTGCAEQVLELAARPTKTQDLQSAQISQVNIERAP